MSSNKQEPYYARRIRTGSGPRSAVEPPLVIAVDTLVFEGANIVAATVNELDSFSTTDKIITPVGKTSEHLRKVLDRLARKDAEGRFEDALARVRVTL